MRIDRFLSNAYTSIRLIAEVVGQSLSAVYAVGIFLKFFFASDEAELTDEQTLQISKPFSEDPNLTDADVLDIGKTVGNDILQDYCDVGYFAEDYIQGPLGEIIFIAAEDTQIDFTKSRSDDGIIDDVPSINLSRPLSDDGESDDLHKINVLKPFTELPSANDDDFVEFTKIAGDDTAQNYCDQSYFSEDYIEGDPTDLAFFTDDNVISITRFLTDQTFVTDDLDGEASTEDDQEIAFVKTRAEIGTTSDTFERTVVYLRDFVENGSASESDVKLTTKITSDSGTVSDFGGLRSQNYCDSTYFAEDYVGASRTFT